MPPLGMAESFFGLSPRDRADSWDVGAGEVARPAQLPFRDSSLLSDVFHGGDSAVIRMIQEVVQRPHAAGQSVALCGQVPSDDPEVEAFLAGAGINSIAVSPNRIADVVRRVA